jgi:signal transduction histidine kinase
VVAPEPLPALPAGTEVAAYLIAMEALTNMLRHAQARHGQVCLEVEQPQTLVVRVTDDGCGVPAGVRSRGGLGTMRERAEEVGGTLVVEAGEPAGTVVTARLPLQGSSTG